MDTVLYLLFLGAVVFTIVAQIKVNRTFKKYSAVRASSGLTGRDAARLVLYSSGIAGVQIAPVSGSLTDNYNPQTNTISLSEDVYGAYSVAAAGVAAHEAGHACQHAADYYPLRIRNLLVPVCNFTSKLTFPLLLIGMLLTYFNEYIGVRVMMVAVAAYAVAVVFQIITLPVEFDASKRAMAALSGSGRYTPDELAGAKKVLSAAALTYVAAMSVSLLQLLRLLLMVSGRRR